MIDGAMIEEIVIEILKKLRGEHDEKPNLLVINFSEDAHINWLKKQWNVIEMNSKFHELPLDVQDAVFLNVTQDFLVKGALGIADTPESKILCHLIMQGFRIRFIPSLDLEWILDFDVKKVANSAYVSHLANYKKILESFGVQIIPLAELVPTGSVSKDQITFHGKLLKQSDVETIKDEKIVIHKSTIVTPLGRDAARERGKSICVIDSL